MRASQGAHRGGFRGGGEERGQQDDAEEAAAADHRPVPPVQVRRVLGRRPHNQPGRVHRAEDRRQARRTLPCVIECLILLFSHGNCNLCFLHIILTSQAQCILSVIFFNKFLIKFFYMLFFFDN